MNSIFFYSFYVNYPNNYQETQNFISLKIKKSYLLPYQHFLLIRFHNKAKIISLFPILNFPFPHSSFPISKFLISHFLFLSSFKIIFFNYLIFKFRYTELHHSWNRGRGKIIAFLGKQSISIIDYSKQQDFLFKFYLDHLKLVNRPDIK